MRTLFIAILLFSTIMLTAQSVCFQCAVKKMEDIAKEKGLDFSAEQATQYLNKKIEQKDPSYSAEKMNKAYDFAGEVEEFAAAAAGGPGTQAWYAVKKSVSTTAEQHQDGDPNFRENIKLNTGYEKEEFDKLPESQQKKLYKDYENGSNPNLYNREDWRRKPAEPVLMDTKGFFEDNGKDYPQHEKSSLTPVELNAMTPAERKKWFEEQNQNAVDDYRAKNGMPLKDEEPKPAKTLTKWSVDDDKQAKEVKNAGYWGDESAPVKSNANGGKANPLDDNSIYTSESNNKLDKGDFDKINNSINQTAANKQNQISQSMSNNKSWAEHNNARADQMMNDAKALEEIKKTQLANIKNTNTQATLNAHGTKTNSNTNKQNIKVLDYTQGFKNNQKIAEDYKRQQNDGTYRFSGGTKHNNEQGAGGVGHRMNGKAE